LTDLYGAYFYSAVSRVEERQQTKDRKHTHDSPKNATDNIGGNRTAGGETR
jgi:hypothetical protein